MEDAVAWDISFIDQSLKTNFLNHTFYTIYFCYPQKGRARQVRDVFS